MARIGVIHTNKFDKDLQFGKKYENALQKFVEELLNVSVTGYGIGQVMFILKQKAEENFQALMLLLQKIMLSVYIQKIEVKMTKSGY